MAGSEAPPSLLVGDVVAGKYRIDSVAGEGGMGIVYEAEHLILRKRVALKVLRRDGDTTKELLERFSSEARAAASIASEHVVRVLDAGSLENTSTPYLVMEWLDGADLGSLLERYRKLDVREVVDYALQALEGLAHAHAAGIVHRDLKPANLFLARGPERTVIKLLDFGIARSLESDDDKDDAGERRLLGSPLYMSPEQLSRADVDLRTDLWSLGVVIYQLVSGTTPFGGSLGELVNGIVKHDAAPLHSHDPSIPEGLSKAVGRCLARDPGQRWANAAALAEALAPYGTGAWAHLVEKIGRVVSQAAPAQKPRRFESFETALQALEPNPSESPPTAPELDDTQPPPGQSDPQDRVTRLPARLPETREKPRLRVLLIDDSEVSLAVHEHLLQVAGFDVRTSMTPGEFEVLLVGWSPHLVLMDVQMPEVNGDVLCRQIKQQFGGAVPIVLFSDLPPDVLESRAKEGGADAYMPKSTRGQDFVDYVRNICAITYSPEDLP